MERRGSRVRRRMLTVDTGLAEATCNNGGGLGAGQGYGAGGEEDEPPVIDTTSVEVKRKADGKQHTSCKTTPPSRVGLKIRVTAVSSNIGRHLDSGNALT